MGVPAFNLADAAGPEGFFNLGETVPDFGLSDVAGGVTEASGMGPVGWIGLALLGAKYGPKIFDSLFGHKSTKEIQQERMKALLDRNVAGYAGFLEQSLKDQSKQPNYEGQVAAKYAPDYKGFAEGSDMYVNNPFASSRSESELTPYDIWGGTGLFETFGDDWLGGKYSEKDRYDISQALLNEGLIQEKQGGIYVLDQDKAKEIAEMVQGGKYDFGDTNTGYLTAEQRGSGSTGTTTRSGETGTAETTTAAVPDAMPNIELIFESKGDDKNNKTAAANMAYNIAMSRYNDMMSPLLALQEMQGNIGRRRRYGLAG